MSIFESSVPSTLLCKKPVFIERRAFDPSVIIHICPDILDCTSLAEWHEYKNTSH